MRNPIWVVLLLVASAMAGEGYMYFGPGSSNLMHVGGGGEARVYKGLGVGSELGFLFPREEFLYGAGLLSVNTSYRWNAGTHWKVTGDGRARTTAKSQLSSARNRIPGTTQG